MAMVCVCGWVGRVCMCRIVLLIDDSHEVQKKLLKNNFKKL